jgi:DNA modification methylase
VSASVVRANATALPLADESVDLIVTSPPYFAMRSYQDGGEHYAGQIGSEPSPLDFMRALWAVTAECKRVLKPSGSIFVNLGDKYAGSGGHNNSSLAPPRTGDFGTRKHNKQAPRTVRASRRQAPDSYNKTADVRTKSLLGLPWMYALGCTGALAGAGGPPLGLDLILRAELLWAKPNGMPESAQDRVHRRHEQWFHFTKEPDYFSDIDAVRQPHDPHTLYCADWEADQGGYQRARRNPSRQDGGNNTGQNPSHPLGKIPGSVWTVATDPLKVPDHLDVDHFAAFPREWPRRLVLGWSPANGVVLDPFGGTGTTAMVARALGRYGVSVDLSADYLRLARWRIFDSDGASKVRERTNGERQATLL